MKRILLTFVSLLMLFGFSNAQSVTFDFSGARQDYMRAGISASTNTTTLATGMLAEISPITLSITTLGQNGVRWWAATNNNELRVYAGSKLTITCASGYTITAVSPSAGSAVKGTDGSWTISGPSTGNTAIKSINVTYESDGGEVIPPVDPDPVDPTPGGNDQWILVNNVADLEEGAQYIIAHLNGSSYYAMNTTVTSNKIQSDKVNVSDNLLTPVETTAIFELVADSNGKWKLKCTNNNNFLNVSTGNTNLNFNASGTANTIQFEGNYVLIDNTRRVFPNTNNGYGSYAISSNWGGSGYCKPSLYKKQVSDDPNKTPVTLSYDENTYTATKGEDFNAPKLNVTPEEALNAVSYKTDNTNVATVDASGSVTVKELGKTTVKAEISDNKTYANASASYTLNVIKDGEYTVAEALTAIKNGYEGKARVKGIITSIDEISEQYKNATYNISDDAAGTNSLQVFRGKWLDGADFSGNEIQVGGTVVVEGDLTNYNGTLEVGTGNVVISYIPPVAQDFTGFEKYEEDDIELEVGDEFTLDLGDKYPVITYSFDEEGIISITDNKVKALSAGTAIVTASWNADDNWTAGSAEFMVDVTAAQLGEIIATVSDGTELVNDGTITISEGTTITFTAKNAKQIVLITADDNVEDAEVNGDTLVWTPSLCEDEVVMVEAYMDPENKENHTYFEFTLTVEEKQAEKGTEENPYTVTEFNDNFSNANGNNVWVIGYIVGSRDNSINYFGQSENHVATNLLLSDDADASSSSLYIPVELQTAKNIRADLNVKDNANHIGRKVMLYGSAQAYFGMNGLKSVTDYKFLDEKTPDPTPELSFTFEGQTVTEPIELGWDATEFPTLVTPEDAEFDVTYTSSDTKVAEIDEDGNITLKGIIGETVITAETAAIEGQYAAGSVSYTLVILDPNSAKGMFNFNVENPYGMTSTDNSGTYQEGSITANEKDVTLVLNGRFRSWKGTNSFDLRVYSTGTEAGSLTFSVPAGYKLETIEFTGKDLNNLTTGTGKYKNPVWEAGDEIINSVTFTASGTAQISTIDVYYTMLPAPELAISAGADDTVQSGEVDNDGLSIKMYSREDKVIVFITTPEGTTPWYYVEVTNVEDFPADGNQGVVDQLGKHRRVLPAESEYQEADVYNDTEHPEYENNGQHYAVLTNEKHTTSGLLHIIYKDENGQTVSSPATYNFEVVKSDPTGVETVVVGEGEVIYFDLNGRRVQNPDKGIFIKVEADKVSKVIL